MPRQPGAKPRTVRPRPVAKRIWASLEHEPAEVVAEAMLEAERQDPEHVKRWVVLVDGAETQLDLVETGAAAYGVDVTVILDIIHVVEYVWKAARDRLEALHATPGAGDTGGELVGLSSLAELRHVTEILADAATRGR